MLTNIQKLSKDTRMRKTRLVNERKHVHISRNSVTLQFAAVRPISRGRGPNWLTLSIRVPRPVLKPGTSYPSTKVHPSDIETNQRRGERTNGDRKSEKERERKLDESSGW